MSLNHIQIESSLLIGRQIRYSLDRYGFPEHCTLAHTRYSLIVVESAFLLKIHLSTSGRD